MSAAATSRFNTAKLTTRRRRIPIQPRVAAVLEMRKTTSASDWVFPAATRSGHIEPASLKRQHLHACEGKVNAAKNARRKEGEPRTWSVELFPLYTLRHTCLTRWAPHMDPWALAYIAGHRDMSITKRYIHPQQGTLKEAIEKARSANTGHTTEHTAQIAQCATLGDTALKA